ncbi:MAG: DUF2064 domain-containing protein, partial [Kiloniellaceae bacterium]
TAARRGRGLWPAPGRGRSCRLIPQGDGGLGARLARLLERLPPGPVVIVGSDVPGIGAAQIARAFALLGAHDWVFGPAPDGGYWLIGARRRPGLRDPFARVRWGSEYALADTVANLAGARIAYLDELGDVDTGADLAKLRQAQLRQARLRGRPSAPFAKLRMKAPAPFTPRP